MQTSTLPPSITDDFQRGCSPHWGRLAIGQARIEEAPGTIRFAVEGASAEMLADAEIGDYHRPRRDRLPWKPPLILEVRARFSNTGDHLLGTAGFGFWNNPFQGGAVTAPPQALWFFFASNPSRMSLDPKLPGHGWKAASLNSGRVPGWMVTLGNLVFSLPMIGGLAYQVARTTVASNERYLDSSSLADWHDYQIEWRAESASFRIDGQEIYRAARPPTVPLGFVAWMDNQYAVLSASGELNFGLLPVPHRQWLELGHVRIAPTSSA